MQAVFAKDPLKLAYGRAAADAMTTLVNMCFPELLT